MASKRRKSRLKVNKLTTQAEWGTTAPHQTDEAQPNQRRNHDPHVMSAHDVLHLQRTIGNRAVTQMLQGLTTPLGHGTIQREPQPATITKQGGAGIHKSNRKKVALGEAEDLTVRSGGIFRTGIKITVPQGATVTVDMARESSNGNYVWVRYTTPQGATYVGYINKANLTLNVDLSEDSESSEEVAAVQQPPTQVELDIALARQLLDGYLETHTIGQHMGGGVRNRQALTEDAGRRAKEAETWALSELGVAKDIGKTSSERQKERLEIDRERQKELLKQSKEELVDLLIKLVPEEEAFRDVYLEEETSKFDLVSQIVRTMSKDDESQVAKKKPEDEVWKRPEFWQFKGQQLLENPMAQTQGGPDSGKIPIWCDQSTAIIVATLRGNPNFKSSLTVIKQGDPKQHGHWYVLANHGGEDAPAYGDALAEGEFIVDIWGALRLKEGNEDIESVVFDEGQRQLLNAAVVDPEDAKDELEEKELQKQFDTQNKLETFARFEERED